jgi:hypothetical protein
VLVVAVAAVLKGQLGVGGGRAEEIQLTNNKSIFILTTQSTFDYTEVRSPVDLF